MLRSRCLILLRKQCLLAKSHNNRCSFVVVRRNLYQLQSFLRLSSVLYRLASTPGVSFTSSAKMAAATWSMGPGTLEVPLSLFAKNRNRLADKLKSGQVVVLEGGEDISHYDTDIEYVFRQEAYFTWICGVREPGCYFALDVGTRKSYLFVPRLPEDYEIWMGRLLSCEDFKKLYAVDEVHYVDELQTVLKSLKPEKLLTLCGPNTDSGLTAKEASFEGIDEFQVDNETLFPVIAELYEELSSCDAAGNTREECAECGIDEQETSTQYQRSKYPYFISKSRRLDSFKNWPVVKRQKPEDLADAGFFYTGHEDRTKCFHCGQGLKDWEDNDDPWQQHIQWYSECAYVKYKLEQQN